MDSPLHSLELPGFEDLENNADQLLRSHSRLIEVPDASIIFRPGNSCPEFLWLLHGSLRVQMVGDTGRIIVLYRVSPGDTCIVTTSCLMSGSDYNAEAIAESAIEAIGIPRNIFHELVASSPVFREKIFTTFGQRIGTLLSYIEEISFGRLDRRLARFLLDYPGGSAIDITHEMLARELGSQREVVSRLLKEFERNSLIQLGRGRIVVRDPNGLEKLFRESI